MKYRFAQHIKSTPRGFTLIEMLVSVAIFSTVMVIALGALLSMSEANRKAETLKSVINNLNFSLDSMSRSIRTASDYRCGAGQYVACPTGATQFQFIYPRNTLYRLETSNATLCGQVSPNIGCITRSIDGGTTYAAITSPEVIVTNLKFYLVGNSLVDNLQSRVFITLSGYVRVSSSQNSIFNLQTSVTQRLYDQ